jgi:YHS domain-containing protein
MAKTTVVKDVVCGMDIDADSATAKSEYKGQAYYFCCRSCKAKFDKAPEPYLRQPAENATGGGCGGGCGCG